MVFGGGVVGCGGMWRWCSSVWRRVEGCGGDVVVCGGSHTDRCVILR